MWKPYSLVLTVYCLFIMAMAVYQHNKLLVLQQQLKESQANNRVLLSIVVEAIGSK